MDMYQKRKMRADKKQNDKGESFSKVYISWYIPSLINFQSNPYLIKGLV